MKRRFFSIFRFLKSGFCISSFSIERNFCLTINIFLLVTLYFLERIENIQETVEQVKNTTEKNFQDLKEIKDDVTQIKG